MITTIDCSLLRPIKRTLAIWKFYLSPGDLVELSYHTSIGIVISLCGKQATVLWSQLDLDDAAYFSPYVPLQVTPIIFKQQ